MINVMYGCEAYILFGYRGMGDEPVQAFGEWNVADRFRPGITKAE